MCTVILKAHKLTGNDVTGFIGTKRAPVKTNANQYFQHVGLNAYLNDDEARQTEQSFVKVLYPTSNSIALMNHCLSHMLTGACH